MPTQREYWRGEFTECPNCPNTNDGDIIYECKETFLGGIADDISAALGEEITHCGKVFCKECGTILHYCPNPDCNGLGSMIGKIRSDSSNNDEPDSDDDSSDDYESDSDDDSSSDSSDYASPAKYASSAPSKHASGQNNLATPSSPPSLSLGYFVATIIIGGAILGILQTSKNNKEVAVDKQNKPAIHNKPPLPFLFLLFAYLVIFVIIGGLFTHKAFEKYYKKGAPVEQSKSVVRDPWLEVGGSGINDGIGGVSGSSYGDNNISGGGSTGVETSQDLLVASDAIPQQAESEPLSDDAVGPALPNNGGSYEEDSSVDFIIELEEPHAIDGTTGVVEQTIHSTLTTTGQRLPGTEILVRFDNGDIYPFSLPQDEDIKVGNRIHFIYHSDR